MKEIRRQRNYYALLLLVCIFLTVYFSFKQQVAAVIFPAALGVALLVLLIRQNHRLFDATLIRENRILAVPSAWICSPGKERNQEMEETIVSTFGLLLGSKIYKWGSQGIQGARLTAIHIDRARLALSFGLENRIIRVELLHGLIEQEEVLQIQDKFRRETGIFATVNGWETDKENL